MSKFWVLAFLSLKKHCFGALFLKNQQNNEIRSLIDGELGGN